MFQLLTSPVQQIASSAETGTLNRDSAWPATMAADHQLSSIAEISEARSPPGQGINGDIGPRASE